CDVKVFGDSRCKFDVAAATRTATVIEVTNRKHFTVALDAGPEPLTSNYYDGARLVFTSGANETFIRETRFVMLDETAENGTVILWEEAPADIEVGDTISLPPGCNRLYTTCRDVHQNLVNFRGHGIF